MHPNGQIPAYEFALRRREPAGARLGLLARLQDDRRRAGSATALFLARVFQKLLLNFTWWVNRKDAEGKNLFAGGFLGLDNIGVFDRSQAAADRRPPGAGRRHRVDGVLLRDDAVDGAGAGRRRPGLRGHRLQVLRALRRHRRRHEHARRHRPVGRGGRLLLRPAARRRPARRRCGCARWSASCRCSPSRCSRRSVIDRLPGFSKRMELVPRATASDLARHIAYMRREEPSTAHRAAGHPVARAAGARAALPARRERVPVAATASARCRGCTRDAALPYFARDGQEYRVDYVPGESNTGLFGGNSNWRGPVWFPVNYLLIEALERYHHFYGDSLQVECPTGSGRLLNLQRGGARAAAAGWRRCSCPTPTAGGPATATTRATPSDPHLARPGAVPRVLPRRHRPRRRAPATRPAGPRW